MVFRYCGQYVPDFVLHGVDRCTDEQAKQSMQISLEVSRSFFTSTCDWRTFPWFFYSFLLLFVALVSCISRHAASYFLVLVHILYDVFIAHYILLYTSIYFLHCKPTFLPSNPMLSGTLSQLALRSLRCCAEQRTLCNSTEKFSHKMLKIFLLHSNLSAA